ncbi:MFS transporter [Thalassiella azotivora]
MTAPAVPGDPARPRAAGFATLAAVLLVAFNLRSAIAVVGPVLPRLRDDLDLSASAAGLLTSLPVLCFAVVAPASAWLGRRVGTDAAMVLGAVLLVVGSAGRVVGGPELLLLGTFVAGAGMTVGNVLVPVAVKRDFGRRAGQVTGLFTASLAVGATLATAAAAPVADLWGWRASLAVWSLPAAAGALAWWLVTRRPARPDPAPFHQPAGTDPSEPAPFHQGAGIGPPGTARFHQGAARGGRETAGRWKGVGGGVSRAVWRHPTAWLVAVFLAAQSVGYYVVTAWLPTYLVEDGVTDLITAGVAATVFQVVGIAGTLLVPALTGVRRDQVLLGAGVGVVWVVAVGGFLLVPSAWLAWTVLAGIGQGAGISFAFTAVVLRADDADVATVLSGMSQLVGYALAAAAPVAAGVAREVTGGWTVPLLGLLAVAVVIGVSGALAGRDRTISATGRTA